MSNHWRRREEDRRAAATILVAIFEDHPWGFVFFGCAAFWAAAAWVGIVLWEALR